MNDDTMKTQSMRVTLREAPSLLQNLGIIVPIFCFLRDGF